jgi:hypothetical protein
VESSCERGNEPSGSIKCWELPSGCTTCGLSSGTHPHRVKDHLLTTRFRIPAYILGYLHRWGALTVFKLGVFCNDIYQYVAHISMLFFS